MKAATLVVSVVSCWCSAGYAGTIYYTFTGSATGDYNGTPLNTTPFTIVLTGDTGARTGSGPAYQLTATAATVGVDGFPTADFSDTMSVYVNGLFTLNSSAKGSLFEGTGPADLISPGGPYGFGLFSHAGQTQFNSVATTGGLLTFSSLAGGAMTVSLGTTGIPEPSTSVLTIGALLGLSLLGKLRLR
ncbi:MAG TPA: hypothetical protein VFA33_11650 [Bryobacteraceae bacterium]|nr:hypothetical protein [Bryobacteraceae bacterium]